MKMNSKLRSLWLKRKVFEQYFEDIEKRIELTITEMNEIKKEFMI